MQPLWNLCLPVRMCLCLTTLSESSSQRDVVIQLRMCYIAIRMVLRKKQAGAQAGALWPFFQTQQKQVFSRPVPAQVRATNNTAELFGILHALQLHCHFMNHYVR